MSLGMGTLIALTLPSSMATWQEVATTRHHTESFSGILTNQYLPSQNVPREGKARQKMTSLQVTLLVKCPFRNYCEQETVYKGHKVSLPNTWEDC